MAIRWKLVAGITAATLAIPAAVAAATSRARVEEPKHEVTSKYDGFEVRRYEPRLVAEVVVEGNGKKATNAGFRLLADFIFGNNTSRTKVAMTAPVDRTASEKVAMTAPVDRTKQGKRWRVAFTMPSKYTQETLPKPNDERVRIREVPAKTYAVTRFSGAPSDKVVAQRIDEFVDEVERAGLERTDAEPTYARYDPPWTPPFLRRNEIFVELRTPSSGEE